MGPAVGLGGGHGVAHGGAVGLEGQRDAGLRAQAVGVVVVVPGLGDGHANERLPLCIQRNGCAVFFGKVLYDFLVIVRIT